MTAIPKISIEDMAEIMELREGGKKPVAWENLGMIFGIDARTVKKYYRQSKEYGFYLWTNHRDMTDMD